MRIRLYNYQFNIAWLPLILVLVMLVLMIKLGIWQLSRAEQKKVLLDSVANAQKQQTQVLYLAPEDFAAWQYRKIEITGHYIKDKQLLLDNQFSGRRDDKRAGYDVLTPFVLRDGTAVLVNRGWLPRKDSKADLPNIEIHDDVAKIKGIVRLPAKSFSLGQMSQADSSWPKLIQFVDIEQLTKVLGFELHNAIVMLLPDEPAGYQRYWQTKHDIKMGPVVHYGYAFQWFALAATLLVLSIYIVIKKSKKVST